ncbi:hypothetical protein TNCT_576221 [Trichonephila clavata]|uniref:Uncharacterized protein n=1 Tax=Trichonephila clavata TaxID=2740835 RepID=A0A8X6H5T8_TRICU|nr:hypothetical protein TNCT_576221 [Trichonephila clavata]
MGNLKGRINSKRKRQFRGNGSTNKDSTNCSSTSTNASSSKIKMPAVFDEELAEAEGKQEKISALSLTPLGFRSSKKSKEKVGSCLDTSRIPEQKENERKRDALSLTTLGVQSKKRYLPIGSDARFLRRQRFLPFCRNILVQQRQKKE